MRDFMTRAIRRSAVAVVGAFVLVESSGAQVTLQAKQGDAWTSALSVSSLQDMSFRWTYSSGALTNAMWQLAYTAPTGGSVAVVKSATIGAPSAAGSYAFFNVPAAIIPGDHPATFYIRVRTAVGYSPWVTVSVGARRATISGDNTNVGSLTDPVRAGTTSTSTTVPAALGTPVPPAPPEPPPSLLEPLWLKLTKIVCEQTSDDGNPDDEVYALVTTIAVNRQNPKESRVSTKFTQIFEGVNEGEGRGTDVAAWHPVDGEAVAIADPGDILVLGSILENDGDVNRALLATLITGAIVGRLSQMTSSTSRSTMIKEFQDATFDMLDQTVVHFSTTSASQPSPRDPSASISLSAGEDFVGTPGRVLAITSEDLAAARQGTIIKKSLTFDGGGKYHLRFQLGKKGMTTVSW